MRHKLFSASCMVAVAVMGAAPAYADNLHGNMCGSPASANPASSAPGNSATSPGGIHNEPATPPVPGVSLNGGNATVVYNTNTRQNNARGPGAPSNYDTSCANVTAASTNNPNSGAGTPIQQGVAPLPTQVPNNSLATRTASGVTPHSTSVQNRK